MCVCSFTLLIIRFVYVCNGRARPCKANGQVIPYDHPCCIFLSIFIFYVAGAGRENRESTAGKAWPLDDRNQRQGHPGRARLFARRKTFVLAVHVCLHNDYLTLSFKNL